MTGSGEPPHVVFLDRDTLSPETRLRAPAFPHRMEVFAKTAPAEVADRIRDAEIVITNKAPLRREVIAGARNLRLVAVAATGTDVAMSKLAPSAASLSRTFAITRSTRSRSIPSPSSSPCGAASPLTATR
jgi:phosphoglycerate dehydrogenase-like enzyme